jgi:hypothetical protein
MREANKFGELQLGPLELRWLERLSRQADELPQEEEELLAAVMPQVDPHKVSLKEYEVPVMNNAQKRSLDA